MKMCFVGSCGGGKIVISIVGSKNSKNLKITEKQAQTNLMGVHLFDTLAWIRPNCQ